MDEQKKVVLCFNFAGPYKDFFLLKVMARHDLNPWFVKTTHQNN